MASLCGRHTHYVREFATFPSNNPCGLDQVFLALAPVGDGGCFDTDEHFEFLQTVLSFCHKSLQNVVALVGDNASKNLPFPGVLFQYF